MQKKKKLLRRLQNKGKHTRDYKGFLEYVGDTFKFITRYTISEICKEYNIADVKIDTRLSEWNEKHNEKIYLCFDAHTGYYGTTEVKPVETADHIRNRKLIRSIVEELKKNGIKI